MLAVLVSIGLIILAGTRVARLTLSRVSGAIRLTDLHSSVTVARDTWGVPYLYSADEHDMAIAQGYVTAQDRLWQMLLRRQAARGQLTAWLGAQAARPDEILRRESFASQADVASSSLETATLASLRAYTAGVNACLQTCPQPLELELLKRQGKVSQIEPWTVADSVSLALMLKWAEEQQTSISLLQALTERLGQARAVELWPEDTPPDPLVPSADSAMRAVLRWTGLRLVQDGPRSSMTEPGLPVAWYVAVLHSERSAVSGATWPGLPGVIVDHINADWPTHVPEQQHILIQYLLALPPEGWLQSRVHGMLRQWNYDLSGQTRLGNASAAVYQVWLWYLARDTFQDELGTELFNRYWVAGLAPQALARLSTRLDHPWWDDVTTPKRESRDDTMRRAYAEALSYLGRHYGDLHTIWEWDTLHAAHFRHPLGETWPLAQLVDRTLNLGGDAPFDPGRVGNAYAAYMPVSIPAVQINENKFALAGGQSGNPFSPHYVDLLPLWQRGQTVPLQDATRPEDLKDVEGVLVLTP